MNKPFSFRSLLIGSAMLFLCSIFMQSCTEEMPILTPPSTPANISAVVLKINNKTYTIINKTPGYVYFSNVTVGSGNNLYSQYNLSASNGSQVNTLDYLLNFGVDPTNASNYTFATSQLNFNNKTYTTTNSSGKAQFKINQLDDLTNTANGSFGYYLYDSVSAPTDSIYISGTFNIIK